MDVIRPRGCHISHPPKASHLHCRPQARAVVCPNAELLISTERPGGHSGSCGRHSVKGHAARSHVGARGAKTSETKENVTATKLAKIWAESAVASPGVDEALAEGTKERNARKTSWHRYSDSTPLVAFPGPSSVVWPLLRCRWPTPQIGQLASVGDAQVQR